MTKFFYSILTLILVIFLQVFVQECESVQIKWFREFINFFANSQFAIKYLSANPAITTQKLISNQGYPVETHRVTTEDDYILEIHRIPHGTRALHPHRPNPKIPVILFHGNSQSSADWVINVPNEDSLGFYLADSGYDVWIANQRGNDYSTRHTSLTLANPQFWNYSVHEIGVYDIPAIVDYIVEHTGHPRMHFVGFSLSNTALLIALAKRPEYNEKIGGAVMLAPAVFFRGFLYGLVKFAAPIASFVEIFNNFVGGMPLLPHVLTNIFHRVMPVLCHPNVDLIGICGIILRVAFGNDHGLIGKEKMSLITSVAPSPFSLKLAIYGMQQLGTGEFREYDYGISKNMQIYGASEPPQYNLTNVQVPVVIMVGPADFLGNPKDARILATKLPNVVDFYYVGYPVFRHLDFCYAKGVGKLVYSQIIKYLDAFG